MSDTTFIPALPAELSIYSVTDLRRTWLARLAQDQEMAFAGADAPTHVQVDGSGVETIDGAGLQLLVSLAHSLGQRRLGLRIVDPSDVLVKACEAFRLSGLITLSSKASGGTA